MKRLVLLSLILSGAVIFSFGQTTWDDFESNRRAHYSFVNGVFVPYLGNPDPVGNTSSVVAQYTRNAAELFDVLVIDGDAVMEDLAPYLSNTKQMSIDVWSPAAGITVQITLEDTSTAEPANFPTGRHSVYLATTTQDSAWETLTFTFDNRPDAAVPDTIVTRIVLLFNPNTNTDGTYFFDNLIGPEFAVDPCAGATSSDSLLTDFECEQDAFVTFNHGASLRRVPNPDQSGINTSDFMASYIRNPGEEFDVIVGGFSQPIVFGDTNAFRIHVWDGNAPTGVRLAIQYRDDAGNTLLDISDSVSTTAASQWEELTFRFGDLSDTTVNTFVLLFDPGDFTNDTYFWDNMTLVSDANLVNIEDYLENGNVQVFPNPSQGLTQFQYDLRQAGEVSISIHDISGRLVDEIRPGFQGAGPQQLSWENRSLEAGMYFYTFQVNEQITGGKIVISR